MCSYETLRLCWGLCSYETRILSKVYWITEEFLRILLEEIASRKNAPAAPLRVKAHVSGMLEKARDRYASRTGWQSYKTSINRLDWVTPEQVQQLEGRLSDLIGSGASQLVAVEGASNWLELVGRRLQIVAQLDVPHWAAGGRNVAAPASSGSTVFCDSERPALCQLTFSTDPQPSKITAIKLALETLCAPEEGSAASSGSLLSEPKRRRVEQLSAVGPRGANSELSAFLYNVRRNELWRVRATRLNVLKVLQKLFSCMIASAVGPSDEDFFRTMQGIVLQYKSEIDWADA